MMLWDESHVCLEIDIREGKPGLVLGGAARGADAREGQRLPAASGAKAPSSEEGEEGSC